MSLLHGFISVITSIINKNVDTGDRQFDMVLTGFLTMLISTMIGWICLNFDKNYINRLLYIYKYKKPDPTNFSLNDYYFDIQKDGEKYLQQNYFQINNKYFTIITELIKNRDKVNLGNLKNLYPIYYDGSTILFLSYCSDTAYCYYEKSDFNVSNRFNLYLERKYQITNKIENVNVNVNAKNIKCCDGTGGIINIGKINPNKTFDKLFYEQKEEVLKAVNLFKENRLYPDSISMDNKLGILLYGPPGTGKTGTISACANLLNRDIVIIDFSQIKTCRELDLIFRPTEYNKYIYVFDEFDCILDVLIGGEKPKIEEKEEPQTDWSKLLMVAEGEERKEILRMMKEGKGKEKDKNQPINLGYLLRKLDGLEDSSGRFIIATTNNPQNINPVLLRPGRFDIKLCLGNCTEKMYVDILGAFYNLNEEDRMLVTKAKIEPYKWSPIQVINSALIKKSLVETLEYLKN
jgi:hypothetical protein